MKLLLVAIIAAELLLPARGWGQRSPVTLVRPATAAPETKQARYVQLDQYARYLPEIQSTTLEKLAVNLAAYAHTDDDKARLIFAWLAYHVAYDNTYPSGDITQYYCRCKPAFVLQSRKAICMGYADLFTDLATRMKLEAVTVTGHGHNSSATGNVLAEVHGHGWNAYRIASAWHLADATWGAGGTSTETNEFEYRFELFGSIRRLSR
ncbi:MAG: transglutaminase domain-containing protein [Janthinobacterium lividum]